MAHVIGLIVNAPKVETPKAEKKDVETVKVSTGRKTKKD